MTIELLGHEVFIDINYSANVSIKENVANIASSIQAGESEGDLVDLDGRCVGAWNIC